MTDTVMGEAIIRIERLSIYLHNKQRLASLEHAPLHSRVSILMELMNAELSSPDERKELVLARHTKDLLRNSSLKSTLATHMAVQAQIGRLAKLINIVGRVDERLSDSDVVEELTPGQLILAQRSYHAQIGEVLAYLEKQKFDGIDSLLSGLIPPEDTEVKQVVQGLADLPQASREKAIAVVTMLLGKLASKDVIVEEPAALPPPDPPAEPSESPNTE